MNVRRIRALLERTATASESGASLVEVGIRAGWIMPGHGSLPAVPLRVRSPRRVLDVLAKDRGS